MSPEEMASNESVKKFIVQKMSNRLLDSFEESVKSIEDADLISMFKKWEKLTSKEDELDSSIAMKRIIKKNVLITEVVEQHLEEILENGDVDEEEESQCYA